MNYILWEYVGLGSLIAFLICALTMIIAGFTRNRFYHEHHNDELIKESKTVNSKNYLFFTSGETSRYIKKYVFCRTPLDKYVIVNFNKAYRNVSFFVLCYKKNRKRPFRVLRYSESLTGLSSKIISIPKNTNNVNIVIQSCDSQVINYNVIKPLSLRKIRFNAFFMFFLVFSFLMFVRHYVFAFGSASYDPLFRVDMGIFKGLLEKTLDTYENYIIVILSFIIALITSIKAKKAYKKKSVKANNGGTVEYDFNE